jgi:glycosyltransferase involved in cell wall biosynthesis
LLGQGPLRRQCEENASGLENVTFEDWLPYEELPARILRADILLGIFGTTPKADRVIPNKVYQSLACGRPVVTCLSAAYPEPLTSGENSGLVWTKAGNADSLAGQVARLAAASDKLCALGAAAAETSRRYFSESVLRGQLSALLDGLS